MLRVVNQQPDNNKLVIEATAALTLAKATKEWAD